MLYGRVAFLCFLAQLGPVALLSRSTAAEAAAVPLRLSVGSGRLAVEVARTHEELSRGLMFRRSLDEDAGMLFLLPHEGVASFWMANTTIPLSVAFLDRTGAILEIHDLEPLDTRIVSSESARVRFALEVNRDWFARHAVRAGETVRLEGASWQQLADRKGNP
ncbi:DUF192 domain-containing protein [Methylacidimicrobium sp. B4]|uniref:DUF192 domain-containing protein n=1 Tax=Methylacidimicrobium sp. B4 TaxID=2796139 RepID=UPI001A8D1E74|nr:DUF192 domain-containing protein [Methylacidimicrobium sp. B4]QSR84305.1 DUF192 domain-containing protein [Methylacidimicrobium sp. B4]